ncbi:C2H2-type zinc finger transcription factor [Phycomyces blakesleeanus NRRL 1555(-)]|uniref:C2H2-type zinc finger transcription factor n=1 Tax=Phycomyces blakesleeanus (strain ATCC 8743b / DSM 1359 / FGSC 10004 / NBRC 33097 / NRRL 1555) TaxID=763407 RepID=A0A162WGV7_PHYB8|nr:C2H2-type zinc finger transcription factor [Phycomyces blakesleeanus NRRL 1555(-)]OAD67045.1 C2H2-type zinc finger transcription factor [Phycomyces blakesleeanus NRRL 1555(-)]|eukprot:XP_018285085.1 C2H2-type zinc finger transcription factor [Phycomyces blakesleeanus NRRL 1555(-)]
MSHLPGVLFFWKDPERPIDMILLQSDQSKSFDPFEVSNMSENPVHHFIATFAILFISRYVVNKGATILIEFINQLLKMYSKDFQLPTSLIGLQRMTSFSNYANSIKKSVVCEDCHKVYEQDVPLPTHCDFKKHGS